MFLQHPEHERHGQAHHVEIVTINTRNPARGDALDGVGAGFVHGFAGCDIRTDILLGERTHRYLGGFGASVFKPGFQFLVPSSQSGEANAGGDLVRSSGKQTKHAHGVSFIARLAENLAFDDDKGVRAEN